MKIINISYHKEKCRLCNQLINTVKQTKGLPLVPASNNPYITKN
mgnify:CR=1 FL=1